MGDIMIKFWKEYIEMDMVERGEKIEMIVKSISDVSNMKEDEKIKKHALTTLLQSYFDDLLEVALYSNK